MKSDLAAALLHWFAANARDLPWRRTSDPYAIWVSEIMLQQTQVKTVIPYWERWLHELPTVQSLAAASPDKIHKLWEGLGYYTRVRNMHKAAQKIVAGHQGTFPCRFENILELPGIGRYTAGAISSIAFNEPRPILDGNVIRVLTRLFGIEANPREKVTNGQLWCLAAELVTAAAKMESNGKARNACSHLNQSLMELGALICIPRQPKCAACPMRKHCTAFRTGRVEHLPNLGPRVIATARHFTAFVIEHRGRVLVRQRPAGVVNAHLWEFPNIEMPDGLKPALAAKTPFGFPLTGLEELYTIKHSITRYRITLKAFRAAIKPGQARKAARQGSWLSLAELHSLAFTSAHRRILQRLTNQPNA